MNKQLIRDLAITGGIYDCLTDPYDKLENGDHHSSVMVDLERFAELIVKECEKVAKNPQWYSESRPDGWLKPINHVCNVMKQHFGVEE